MIALRRLQIIFLFGVIVCLFSACKEKEVILNSEFYELNYEGLLSGKEYLFSPFNSLADSSFDEKKFNICLVIRYSEICRLKNLPLRIECSSPLRDTISYQNLNLELFDNDDFPIGHGHYGIFELKKCLYRDMNPIENFALSVSSDLKETNGILSLGILCEEIIND